MNRSGNCETVFISNPLKKKHTRNTRAWPEYDETVTKQVV